MKINPKQVFQDFTSFFPMLWAILRGRFKMPWNTLFWAVLCVIYFISPVDILPDVLPVLGITDDSAFILLVLALLHKDLAAFRASKQEAKKIVDVSAAPSHELKQK